jgi:hypothetical protein
MLKITLTIAALALAPVIQISAAHAGNPPAEYEPTGDGYVGGLPSHQGGNGRGSGGGELGDEGLPAHNNNGGDVKPSPTTPQLSKNPNAPGPYPTNHIPTKVHGPNPGPIPLRTQ